MVKQLKEKLYTLKKYLEFETSASLRNEFINGEIITIAGDTTNILFPKERQT